MADVVDQSKNLFVHSSVCMYALACLFMLPSLHAYILHLRLPASMRLGIIVKGEDTDVKDNLLPESIDRYIRNPQSQTDFSP